MKVREAVAAAKGHIQELFADEQIANLGLEEVEFDEATGDVDRDIGLLQAMGQTSRALGEFDAIGIATLAERLQDNPNI